MRPSVEKLRELFHYDSADGCLIVKKDSGKRRAGNKAARKSKLHGYRVISVDGRKYREHVAIWAIVTGTWPIMWLDHKDGDTENNHIENLRLATKSENAQNQKCRKDSVLGMKGVSIGPHGGGFRARVCLNGRRIERAGFATAELAKEFRDLLAEMMHGDFARHS